MGGRRQLIFLAGLIVMLLGILWAGQGSGTIPYPATSPMLNNSQWIYYGALMIVLGLGAMWYARRK
jgi:hypothetical protein